MKLKEFTKIVRPLLKQGEKDGDKWCFIYFSRAEDGYQGSCDMDSGDALIVIEELIQRYGIDPMMLKPPKAGTAYASENK